MGVFYVLHYFLLPESETFTGGKRNTAVFLLGTLIYAVIYTVLVNLRMRHGDGFDGITWAFRAVVAADAVAMAVVYKQYYGRSILDELPADDEQWEYDAGTHSYRKRSSDELRAERDARLAREAARARGDQFREGKRRIRAAKVIQRWWRHRLYAPPDGIVYLRARDHFSNTAAASPDDADEEK